MQNQNILIIVLLGIIVVLFYFYNKRKNSLDEINSKRHEDKERIKREIVEMIDRNKEISTNDLISKYTLDRSTIIRYLDELENEGKVEQKGVTNGVVYAKK